MPVLYIVIPCYNEEKVLPVTAPLFLAKLNSLIESRKIHETSRILFVDDGSKDQTWTIIKALAGGDSHYCGIAQSRNRGHQNALLAGLMEVKDKCEIAISIDCDGQQDVSAVSKMLEAYQEGCDVVYGVRLARDGETIFKRTTGEWFYRVLNWLGAEVIANHADYRLLSRRVLDFLADYKEVNLFLRGIIPLIGFKSTIVAYKQMERIAGESHYPLAKMLALAFDGITSLSVRPIRLVTALGFFMALFSFLGIIYAVIDKFIGGTILGWASNMCLICIIGGIQLICLGIIGEYVGKIYMETKARPRYIISERVGG